jgi:hypothetical protein
LASVRIESIVSWTELMKQAEHCGFVAERLQIVLRREVALLARPARDRVHHAADELPDRSLALGRSDLPAEILRDDDVGGLLGPELRKLDVALLEDELAALVRNHRRAELPINLVERIDALAREEPFELETRDLAGRSERPRDRLHR